MAAFFTEFIGKGARVQLDHAGPDLGRCTDLIQIRINEQANPRAIGLKLTDASTQQVFLTEDIQPAFSRDLFAIFRHHADEVRLHLESDAEDLRCITHLQIHHRANFTTQQIDILIDDMPTIRAQMNGDGVCACGLGLKSRLKDGRLHIVSPEHGTVACLPKRGHVIDINAEMK